MKPHTCGHLMSRQAYIYSDLMSEHTSYSEKCARPCALYHDFAILFVYSSKPLACRPVCRVLRGRKAPLIIDALRAVGRQQGNSNSAKVRANFSFRNRRHLL